MSTCGVFSGPCFPVFYSNTGKYAPEKTPDLDVFHAVSEFCHWSVFANKSNYKEFHQSSVFQENEQFQDNEVRKLEAFELYLRSSRPDVSCKKGILRNFAKFSGKHLRQNLFFFKKETLAQVFSCEFCKISENTFFTEHLSATAFVLRAALKIVEKRKLNFGSFLTLVILRLTGAHS